jgi:Flp pilus assembly protein TadB
MYNGPRQHGAGSGDFGEDSRIGRGPQGRDDDADFDEDDQASMEENLRNRSTWKRFLFMLVVAVLFWLGVLVGIIVILLQFLWVLFTGRTKKEFSAVGRQLAEYSREIVLYMSFNTDERPFPFDRDWPSSS